MLKGWPNLTADEASKLVPGVAPSGYLIFASSPEGVALKAKGATQGLHPVNPGQSALIVSKEAWKAPIKVSLLCGDGKEASGSIENGARDVTKAEGQQLQVPLAQKRLLKSKHAGTACVCAMPVHHAVSCKLQLQASAAAAQAASAAEAPIARARCADALQWPNAYLPNPHADSLGPLPLPQQYAAILGVMAMPDATASDCETCEFAVKNTATAGKVGAAPLKVKVTHSLVRTLSVAQVFGTEAVPAASVHTIDGLQDPHTGQGPEAGQRSMLVRVGNDAFAVLKGVWKGVRGFTWTPGQSNPGYLELELVPLHAGAASTHPSASSNASDTHLAAGVKASPDKLVKTYTGSDKAGAGRYTFDLTPLQGIKFAALDDSAGLSSLTVDLRTGEARFDFVVAGHVISAADAGRLHALATATSAGCAILHALCVPPLSIPGTGNPGSTLKQLRRVLSEVCNDARIVDWSSWAWMRCVDRFSQVPTNAWLRQACQVASTLLLDAEQRTPALAAFQALLQPIVLECQTYDKYVTDALDFHDKIPTTKYHTRAAQDPDRRKHMPTVAALRGEAESELQQGPSAVGVGYNAANVAIGIYGLAATLAEL